MSANELVTTRAEKVGFSKKVLVSIFASEILVNLSLRTLPSSVSLLCSALSPTLNIKIGSKSFERKPAESPLELEHFFRVLPGEVVISCSIVVI